MGPRHHAAALAGFTLLALAHTWPLALHLSTHLPGTHIGDNATFAWNVWWMRQALSRADASFLWTDALFAPDGVSLVLHTHTALGAAAVALLPLDVIAATNLLVIACIALNGFCAYALAAHLTRSRAAALLAGVLFLGAAPLTVRLMGHFNLLYAWTMVCAVGLAVVAGDRRTRGMAIAAGAAVGLVAWADYYLFVYTVLALAILGLFQVRSWRLDWHRRPHHRVRVVIAAAWLLVILFALTVLITGSRSSTNLFTASWVLAIVWCLTTWRVTIRRVPHTSSARRDFMVAGGAACLLVIAPLVWLGIGLSWSGEYVAPPRFWRSAPRGIDLATLVLGPPWNPLIGAAVRDLYAAREIDPMEMSGWLGVIAPLLALLAVLRLRHELPVRMLRVIVVVFFVWSLGAFLHVAGINTGLLLPQQFTRFVPVLSNARMPGRALIVVSLGLALLAAFWARGRRPLLVVGICIAAALGQLAAPLPLAQVPRRGVDGMLATQPPGAVLELPFGYRDGLGARGTFDATAMLGQMVHEHPLVGGFVARLPSRIDEQYRGYLTMSDCASAVAALRATRVRYVIAPVGGAPSWLQEMPDSHVGSDGEHALYKVGSRCP